jgi:hypothetical protein
MRAALERRRALSAERVGRRLTAILAADVVGYSRLMALTKRRSLAQLNAKVAIVFRSTIFARAPCPKRRDPLIRKSRALRRSSGTHNLKRPAGVRFAAQHCNSTYRAIPGSRRAAVGIRTHAIKTARLK